MFRLLFLGNGWVDCVEIWYALGNPLATAYAVVTDGVSLHVRTCTPRFCISQTARPIVFKFGVWVSGHYLSAFHKSWVGYLCTCARADRTSVSQERLGQLRSILVCELGVMNYVLNTIHGWSISARAHAYTAHLYHRNGLTDCVQIWYVDWRSLSKCFPQVMGGVGHLCTCARAPHLRISGSEWPIVLKFDVWLETQ